jgi:hypothetical protein
MVSRPLRFSPSLLALCVAASSSTGCFKPSDDDDEIGDDTGSETDTGDTDTTTEDTTTDTTEGPMGMPPTIEVFTVAGSDSPDPVTSASAVQIVVEASDPDGEIAEVELLRNGEVFATIPAPGPYTAEFLIGGEAFDGMYEFRARAIDDDDLEAMAGPIELSVDVPNGGVLETWTFDGGEDDMAYRVWADEEGTQVLASGMSVLGGSQTLKIERFVGDPWVGVSANPSPATGIVGLPTGDFVAVSWSGMNTSVRLRYDMNGTQLNEEVSDWTPPNVPLESFEAPLDLAVDDEGGFYATGIFATGQNFDTFMLRKFEVDGSEAWNVYGTNPMTYPIPPYAVRIDAAGDTVAVSGQLRQQVDPFANHMWMARFGTNGGLIDQIEIPEFDGMAWAIGLGETGEFMFGGSRFVPDSDSQAWVARYDADGNQLWVEDEGHPGIGATIAADIDPFGDSVVVDVVDCAGGLASIVGCDLRVRKYDPEGTLVWESLFEDDLFHGPSLLPLGGDLHFDRYGYIYVVSSHDNMNQNPDWWVTKFNP